MTLTLTYSLFTVRTVLFLIDNNHACDSVVICLFIIAWWLLALPLNLSMFLSMEILSAQRLLATFKSFNEPWFNFRHWNCPNSWFNDAFVVWLCRFCWSSVDAISDIASLARPLNDKITHLCNPFNMSLYFWMENHQQIFFFFWQQFAISHKKNRHSSAVHCMPVH